MPILLVKWSNERVYPVSDDYESYDAKVESASNRASVYIDMERWWRASEGTPDCDQAGYWQNGGDTQCTLYIGVECPEGEPMCAYKIKLQVFTGAERDQEPGELYPYELPMYIPRDQDYVDVTVPYAQIVNLYYPVLPDESGDLLIFANKTGPIGQNGDTWMLLNIQKNASIPSHYWYSAKDAHPDGSGGPRYVINSATRDPV